MAALALALLLGTAARADVALDPPATCPPGSVPESNHAYAWCEAATCTSSAGCPEGQDCLTQPLCVDTFEMPCGGMVEDSAEPCTFTVHEALGACAEDGSCSRGVCETATRCMRPARPAEEGGPCGGCGGGAPGVGLGALAGLLLVAAGRRR